jgi:hypothetical protein
MIHFAGYCRAADFGRETKVSEEGQGSALDPLGP